VQVDGLLLVRAIKRWIFCWSIFSDEMSFVSFGADFKFGDRIGSFCHSDFVGTREIQVFLASDGDKTE
jgi:hypothetical protein